jgi:hypothetical protein
LKKFFSRNGFYATTQDIFCIIKRLDIDYDETLTFEEFVKSMLLFEIDEGLLKAENIEKAYSTVEYRSPL